MSDSAYTPIVDSRVSAGRLWLPALTHDLMRNDLALFECQGQIEIPSVTKTNVTTAQTAATLNVQFPSVWADDDGLGDLRVLFSIGLEFRVQNGTGTNEGGVYIDGGDNQVNDTTAGWVDATLTKTWTTWPTGWEDIVIKVAGIDPSGPDISVRRQFGNSIDCFYRVERF